MTWGGFFTELQWKQQRWFSCQSWGRCIKKLAAEWSHCYICNIVFILVFLRLVITGVIFKAGIKSYRSIFFLPFVCVCGRGQCACVRLEFPTSGSRQESCDTAAVAWTEPRAASGAPRSLGGSGLWPNWDMPGVPQFLMGCSKARREHGCGCTLSHPSVGRGQHLHVGNFAVLCLDLSGLRCLDILFMALLQIRSRQKTMLCISFSQAWLFWSFPFFSFSFPPLFHFFWCFSVRAEKLRVSVEY